MCHPNATHPVIECSQISKVYRTSYTVLRKRGVRALHNLSFSVSRGNIVGLIGPNGAGKSTLLGIAAGLIRPTSGHMRVCGHSPRSIVAKRELGYMPESPHFLSLYSASGILRYHASLRGMGRREAYDEAAELLGELDLTDVADRPSYAMSHGMRQRLALGVALVGNPSLLILDEPSNGLDPVGIVRLRQLLTKLAEDGKTILVSSHRLGELEKLTSQYIFLHRGRRIDIQHSVLARETIQLRIGLLRQASINAHALSDRFPGCRITDDELTIRVKCVGEVPPIVRALANEGIAITSVTTAVDSLEDVFVRVCEEGGDS